MSEQNAYDRLKLHMVNPVTQDRIDRIENIIGVGNPDVNFCAAGKECWIEIKQPKEPVRFNTPLFGSNHKLSQDQKNWFMKQRQAGGRGFILIATNKRWMLIDGRWADGLNEMTVSELLAYSIWSAAGLIKQDQWRQLRHVLIHHRSQ